jgi:hypothetical protein
VNGYPGFLVILTKQETRGSVADMSARELLEYTDREKERFGCRKGPVIITGPLFVGCQWAA